VPTRNEVRGRPVSGSRLSRDRVESESRPQLRRVNAPRKRAGAASEPRQLSRESYGADAIPQTGP
jgi:hypothetical protein